MSANPADTAQLMKISELADAAGVPVATVRHYLREGLLPEPVKTSRNMAYYPPEFVDRIRLIKRLQEERFMPLRVIRDQILDQAISARVQARVAREEVARRHAVPENVLDRLAELGVLSPDERGYDPDDVQIVEAIARFRAGGYDESLGFTVYDTVRYREALQPLVEEEIAVLLDRLAEVGVERAVEIITAGSQPLRDLIGAMHSKLLLAELRRQASDR